MIILTSSPNTICIYLWLSTCISREKDFYAVFVSERLMFQKVHLLTAASRNNKGDRLSHMKTHSCHVFIIIPLFKMEKSSSSHSACLQDQMLVLKAALLIWFFPSSLLTWNVQDYEFRKTKCCNKLKKNPFILLVKNHIGPLHSQAILSPGRGGLLHGATQPWGSSCLGWN